MPGSSSRWTGRKITLTVMASLGILAMVGTALAGLLPLVMHSDSGGDTAAAGMTTSAAPAMSIRPLSIRPVLDQPLVAAPEECAAKPPPPPSTPGDPEFACDLEKKARYHLGPVGLRLELISATSVKLPLTNFYSVQIGMDPGPSNAFAQYTGANVGKQLAFVRDGVVLAAPTISAPIDGASVQLSGELTAESAETIARMLREGS